MIRFLKHETPIIAGNYFGTKFWVVTHASAREDVTLALLGQSYDRLDITSSQLKADMSIEWTAQETVRDTSKSRIRSKLLLRRFTPNDLLHPESMAIQCHILRNVGLDKPGSKLYGATIGPWANKDLTFYVMPYRLSV